MARYQRQNAAYYATCEDDCFSIEGLNRRELAAIMKAHFMHQHGEVLSDAEAERRVRMC